MAHEKEKELGSFILTLLGELSRLTSELEAVRGDWREVGEWLNANPKLWDGRMGGTAELALLVLAKLLAERDRYYADCEKQRVEISKYAAHLNQLEPEIQRLTEENGGLREELRK